jgi:hypothetical protein
VHVIQAGTLRIRLAFMDVVDQARHRDIMAPTGEPDEAGGAEWFHHPDAAALKRAGFRTEPGGVHLSKTMMLAELVTLFHAAPHGSADIQAQVLEANILGKRTGTARRLALARLNTLYGIQTPNPIAAVLRRLWQRRADSRPLLALLCALAREPLLRDSADAVLPALPGTPVRWPGIAAKLERKHPGRYSPKMLKSLAQNCASTWTQSGHLTGKVNKRRTAVVATPETAAYAALLGALAGFGGPALLASRWMRALDRSEPELLNLLRSAEGAGLLRLRAGGGVVEINVRRPMAETLGVPEIGDD